MTLFLVFLFFVSFVFASSDHAINTVELYQTALVLATNESAAAEATDILNEYQIPTTFLAIPQAGIALPTLETVDAWNNSFGHYGLFVIIGRVSYDYGGSIGRASAITSDQWTQLYNYQSKYMVRIVHLDSWPGDFPDVTLAPGHGSTNKTQLAIFLYPSVAETAKYTTEDLWHRPAKITDTSTTTAFLEFGANEDYGTPTVGGVIQNLSGREQMLFFLSGATQSPTTEHAGHIWIHWGYRGIYSRSRRMALQKQLDGLMTPEDEICHLPQNYIACELASDPAQNRQSHSGVSRPNYKE